MKTKPDKNSASVYSTDHGRLCPGCSKPVKQCTCRRKDPAARGDNIVRVARQTKGRKGSGVTLITGVPLDDGGLRQLARELKQKCGTGGTVKAGIIEIQGDHRDVLLAELKQRGYTVKLAGG
jgi:translation initiation factor 1